MVKLAGNRLKLSSGEIRQFSSAGARERFEKVAQAVKHNPGLKAKLAKGNRLGRA